MIFTEKLDTLMKLHGLTRGSLAEATGIPYNTIVGFYTKGYKNIKLSNLRRLADYFDVTLETLGNDDVDIKPEGAQQKDIIIKKYSELSQKGKLLVENMMDGLIDMERPKERAEVITFIREYVTPAAAGYASPAEGEDYVLMPRDDSVPRNADFAVRIDGDSMEPYIMDKSRVYVSRTPELTDGDVGIFFVDGDMKCKQYFEDNFGNIYLISANRDRSDADVSIPASSGISVFCFGKVLLEKKLPRPKI